MDAESTEPRNETSSLRLDPYDESWPRNYELEAAQLRRVIGPMLVQIEHVGSTAVPGLAAKPIIDMLAAVTSWDGLHGLAERLRALGYDHTPFSDTDDPQVFRKGPTEGGQLRTHHLHVTAAGSSYWRRLLAFRNHLRAHPEDAAAYAQLKRELVSRLANQPDRYTNAKTEFVRETEVKAGLPRSADRWE